MQEWLNWHAWKACVPLKGTAGSNPALSALNISKDLKINVLIHWSFLFRKHIGNHRQKSIFQYICSTLNKGIVTINIH